MYAEWMKHISLEIIEKDIIKYEKKQKERKKKK